MVELLSISFIQVIASSYYFDCYIFDYYAFYTWFGTLMSYYLIVVIWYLVTGPDLIILLVLLVTLLLCLTLLLGPFALVKGETVKQQQ